MEINSSRLATLVAHSQGALVALYFMAKQPSEWVRTHVGSFIAISAPWAGAVSTLKGTPAPKGALCATSAALGPANCVVQSHRLFCHAPVKHIAHAALCRRVQTQHNRPPSHLSIWHAVHVQATAPCRHHDACGLCP